MNKPAHLKQKLNLIDEKMPLNYQKAKLVFSQDLDFNHVDMVKFIQIDKYATNQAYSSGPNKPISRVFSF